MTEQDYPLGKHLLIVFATAILVVGVVFTIGWMDLVALAIDGVTQMFESIFAAIW